MKKTIFVDYKLLNLSGDDSLENKLNGLLASGVDEILVKPVLMSNGYEAKKLRERLAAFEGRFSKIECRSSVLGSEESINFFADILIKEIGFSSEYEYCFVGHGLMGSSNSEYSKLSDLLHSKGILNVEVACLTGEGNINSYLKKVERKLGKNKKTIQVYPLLIKPGKHLVKDIFGQEKSENKSFVQRLEEKGFYVIKKMLPLCSFESFKTRYMDDEENLSI